MSNYTVSLILKQRANPQDRQIGTIRVIKRRRFLLAFLFISAAS
jgi:hypothetical protein